MTSVQRHEERDTILTKLTIPNARCILWCLRSLSVEIRKTQLHLQWPKFNSQLNDPISTSTDFFQNPQILKTISSGHDVIHTPAPFSVWGFSMTMVIVISFAHERKTVLNNYTPELLSRIVQSLTKVNDKV